MFANLRNQTTQDSYVDALTVRLPGAVRIFFQVANAGVLYQEDKSDEGKGLWTEERFLTPSIGSFDRQCSGLRFRSAVAGTPAQVSVELLDEDELGGGADSVAPAGFTVDTAGGVTPEGGTAVSVPIGTIVPFAGSSAPSTQWLPCDGATYNSLGDTTLADLFAAIGTLWGGTGASDFKVPDLRGRLPVGVNPTGPAIHSDVGDTDGRAVNVRTISHHHIYDRGLSVTDAQGGAGGVIPHNAFSAQPTSGDGNNTDYPAFGAVLYLIRAR